VKRTFLLGLAAWAVLAFLHAQEPFWVPADPPQVHYRIDAKADPDSGSLEGTGSLSFRNPGRRSICVLAFDWPLSETSMLEVSMEGRSLALLNEREGPGVSPPLFYLLPSPVDPGAEVRLDFAFSMGIESRKDRREFGTVRWYPRLWWDGIPVHDSFSVKLEVPEGYALAASGRPNPHTGRYEIDGARTFGIYLGKGQKAASREVEGVRITALFTEKGKRAALACLDTAADAVKYYMDWLGFYPHDFLNIIPGGPGRWGGYPFATGIVVIHGEETFKEGEPLTHWQRITAHEIGHEYWGEWVLDPDRPQWLWIGMGIFADTAYILDRKIDPERRRSWMARYLRGLALHYDTTIDVPPPLLSKVAFDRNNVVTHSKGFAVISALDAVLGREAFESVYKNILSEYGGKRLGWREFQKVCERETGENLSWFFDQWVRSNKYLCYRVESCENRRTDKGYLISVQVKRLGTMEMPVPVKLVFEDGTEEIRRTNRKLEVTEWTFPSKAALKDVVLDPEGKLAMLEEPLPEISEKAAERLAFGWRPEDAPEVFEMVKDEGIRNADIWYRLGMDLYERDLLDASFRCFEKVAGLSGDALTRFAAWGWLGLLKDLMGDREEALEFYRKALRADTGKSMGHAGLRITMNRKWVEERLKTPFTYQTLVEIPPQPSVEDLARILERLNWTREGRTPRLIFEKAAGKKIEESSFWFKLGLLLFDSGDYAEAFSCFERVAGMDVQALYRFAAFTWMGHLKDLAGEREEALKYYRLALEHDTGDTMSHGQYGMRINRKWLEKRLETPFTWTKR